jgi:hypothetical protein
MIITEMIKPGIIITGMIITGMIVELYYKLKNYEKENCCRQLEDEHGTG